MLPRMRTAAGVLQVIRQEDPGTEVTLYFIRCIIKSGILPVTEIGRKKLVDADKVIQYIRDGNGLPDKPEEPVYGIRRVEP